MTAVETTAAHTQTITIVVNGEAKDVPSTTVTYEQVVNLAFPTPPALDTKFTVTFRKAKDPKEGSLSAGMSVGVHVRGTIFNVTPTGKS